MKKLSIISILFLAAAILVSCSKESTTAGTVLVPSPQLPASPQPIKVVSQWFSPAFNIVNDRGTVYLKAHQDHETSFTYDRTTHAELAFVKLKDGRASIIRRLSVLLSCSHIISNELCEINFGLSNSGCDVTIRNADRNSPPVITANPFPDMQIRYIVIPKTLFGSLGISWDDYAAVAQALNF